MEKMVSGMGRLRLNPNAAEFVPAALKSSTTAVESSSLGSSKQSHQSKVLNRNDSDDERRQYWKDQLPDDITPDFTVEAQINDDRFSWQHGYAEENEVGLGEVSHLGIAEGVDPLELLVNQFPGFAAQSLADILAANGGDVMLTFEMLTQLELQAEVGPVKQLQTQTQTQSRTLNNNLADFPALAMSKLSNGVSQLDRERNSLPSQQSLSVEDLFTSRPYSSGGSFRGGATNFAAIVRKNAAVPSTQWERERTERLSQTGEFPAKIGEKLGNVSNGALQSTPLWLETGQAVSTMYADYREEARDHARVRNAYFEQARQAYLSGNKALAKDLAAKGQEHNSLMKDAHCKAGEAIFQQRNTASGGLSNGHSQLLDLHGLHVNEAIPLLKRELAALRATARANRQRLQVLICVGTGHHTKGSRTPARLPVAVEKFLAEDEHLAFTEQQPGMLTVMLS